MSIFSPRENQPTLPVNQSDAGGATKSQSKFKKLGLAVALILVSQLTLGAFYLPLPYVVQSAGPTLNVLGTIEGEEVVQIEGFEAESTEGELRLTTVSVQGAPGYKVYLPTLIAAWFDPNQSILPVEALYPDTDDEEGTRLINTVQMSTSQSEAVAAAFNYQGIEFSNNIIIAGVRSDGPAADLLLPGDVIVSMNGQTFTTVQEYVDLAGKTPPSGTIELVVERAGTELSLSVPTRFDQEAGRSLMGVVLSNGFDFPIDVDFAIEGIGGPSAGMIFALGIYDEMTEGDLTGGKKIAGTGTIDAAGNVGPIGGIKQKLVGSATDGAEFFIAPVSNCDEVASNIPDGLNVYAVSNFEEALNVVETIAKANDQNDPILSELATCNNP